jgi:riboflavin kinase/FMN adenylyltransferase
MEIINGIERWPGSKRHLFLALGNFDGVHRGHQRIIAAAIEKARSCDGDSAALIFDPHPSVLLRPDRSFALLTDIADRASLMGALGLDYLIVQPFTDALASLNPEQFVREMLKHKLNTAGVVVGYDYSFGQGARGSADTMQRWGRQLGFSVEVCGPVLYRRQAVSSSAIRELLQAGAVKEAARRLNYYFFRRGRVVRGHGIGKKLVFPTANITVSPRLIWPGRGVYLTAVGGLGEELFFGLTNVGAKPTFMEESISVETYILDFEGDIYNRELCLYFLEKLRETRAFSSPEELKDQINLDARRAGKLIGVLSKDLKRQGGTELVLPASGRRFEKNRAKGEQ